MNEKIKFRRKLRQTGESLAITIPPELLIFFGWEVNDELILETKKGKYGQYLVVYKEKDISK